MSESDLEKVLFVEDEPDIQTIGRIALKTVGGFRVEVCGSGEEALEKATSFAPDLVLLDVMLPGMDGPTIFACLREKRETSRIPVVFMTAKVQSSEISDLRKLGALAIISKPFDPMTLAAELRRIWERRNQPTGGA